MSFDPYAPYGDVVETTVRVVAWNVWGRYGDWAARQAGIEDVLAGAGPDVVGLVESWAAPDGRQVDLVGARLGFDHRLFEGDGEQDGWTSGLGVVSRWPIARHERRALPGDGGDGHGDALLAVVDGPRGQIDVVVVALDYPLGAGELRQQQVRQLAAFVAEAGSRRRPLVLCGDFNAGPDADELRMLTGQAPTAAPGLVFYDAWDIAGDGTPGHTWSNRNPLAAVALWPDRRIDHVLSAWPRAHGVGHPTACALLGVGHEPPLSDHHGVVADLRY
ncbi:MAG TPA: endonuclease/exonuclease/phosphatase family protein [Acidimicrobiales bacterium]|nr:endonuclease/exonuclease/phosphatase family protein [Acidimicrobiales bacterium]